MRPSLPLRIAARPGRALLLTVSVLGLSACGVVYEPSRVSPVETARSANGVGVEVVPMTIETVAFANAESYQPRALPAAFASAETEGLHPAQLHRPAPSAVGAAISGGTEGVAPPAILDPEAAALERRLPPPFEAGPYRVGPGDVLTLSFAPTALEAANAVTGAARLVNARVQATGAVVIPEVGLLQVGGLTLSEIQDELLDQLSRRRIDREIAVDITSFNSQSVALAGAVVAPSIKPIDLSGLTLDEAIASSGGLSRVDPRYGVVLLNRDGETYSIPVADFVANAWIRQMPLKDGDSLFVDRRYDAEAARAFFQDRASQRAALLTERQLAQAEAQAEIERRQFNFDARVQAREDARAERTDARDAFQRRLELGAEQQDFVYVAGEVGRQQRVPMPFENRFTLADVVFTAEGLDRITGDPTEIYVIRRPLAGSGGPEDRLTAFHLNAGNAAYLSLATLFEMRPSDVVFVAAQPITEWDRVMTQALSFVTAASAPAGYIRD